MGIEEVELEGLEYFLRFKKRLEIILTCISDRRDITDEDYSVLQELHRIQREGRLPFYGIICTDSIETTTQIDLFTDNVSHT